MMGGFGIGMGLYGLPFVGLVLMLIDRDNDGTAKQ